MIDRLIDFLNRGMEAPRRELIVFPEGGLEGLEWQQLLDDGVVASGSDIAKREGLHHSTVNELLRLTLLEPAIIQAILAGQQPRCMSLLWFQRNPLPTDWMAQRAVVTGFDV